MNDLNSHIDDEVLYTGKIIKESLGNISILDKFKILDHELVGLENPSTSWDIWVVSADPKSIYSLLGAFKIGTWYAHFWKGDELIVVFNNKIILNRQEAIDYGKSLGFLEEQLDFPTF